MYTTYPKLGQINNSRPAQVNLIQASPSKPLLDGWTYAEQVRKEIAKKRNQYRAPVRFN